MTGTPKACYRGITPNWKKFDREWCLSVLNDLSQDGPHIPFRQLQEDIKLAERCTCGKRLWLRESVNEDGELYVVKFCRHHCGYALKELWKINHEN